MKKILLLPVLLSVTLLASPVVAAPASARPFSLPAHAIEIAPGVFNLGKTYDAKSDALVDGYAFVHKKGNVKSSAAKAPRASVCYGYLASGAKWKTPEPWVMNPSNSFGLSENDVFATAVAGVAKWESAAAFNILGTGTSTNTALVADETATDNVNEVYFGDIADPNTIGVTIVWGIFGGPPQGRSLVEWDQIYNTDYQWSLTGEAGKMDFDNIATHELGHTVGMGDIYTASCSSATMYGYASEGETNKRTLEAADVTGVNTLY